MVFTILQGCLPYSNDWNIRECKCTYGTYGSYYGANYPMNTYMMRSVVDAQLQGIVIDSTIHPIESTSFKISYSSSGTIDANVASDSSPR